jgi:hypothetical protein
MLPTMAGYLKKKSSKGLWQLRYFVTNNSYLNYYMSGVIASTSPTSLQASFDLRRVGEIRHNERVISLVMFLQDPVPATSSGGGDAKAKQQQSVYQLKAETAELAMEWVKALTLRRDCCSMLTPLQWAAIDESERQMNVNDRLNKLFERGQSACTQSACTAADALQGAIAATAHLQHLLYQISQQRSNGGCSKSLMVDMIRTHFLPYHSRLMMELMYIQDLNQHGEGALTSAELLQAMVWLSLYSRCAQQAQMLTRGASTAQDMTTQGSRDKGSPINAGALLSDFPSMKRLCKAYSQRLSFELQQLLKRALRQAQEHIVSGGSGSSAESDTSDGSGESTNPFAASDVSTTATSSANPFNAAEAEGNSNSNPFAADAQESPTSVVNLFYVTIRHTQTVAHGESSTENDAATNASEGGEGEDTPNNKIVAPRDAQSMGRSSSMPTGLSLNQYSSSSNSGNGTSSSTGTADESAAQGGDGAAVVPVIKRAVPMVYQCSCGTAPASDLRRAIRRSISQAVNAEREARAGAVSRATMAVEGVFTHSQQSVDAAGRQGDSSARVDQLNIAPEAAEFRSGIPLLALISLQCCMCAVDGYYKAIGLLIRRRARDVGMGVGPADTSGAILQETEWQEWQKLLCCVLNDADADWKEIGKLFRKATKLAPSSWSQIITRPVKLADGTQAKGGEIRKSGSSSRSSTIHKLMKRACQSKLQSVQCTLSLVMRTSVGLLGRQLLNDPACIECLKTQLFRQEWLDGPSANKGLSLVESGMITLVQTRLIACLGLLPHPTFCALVHYSFDVVIVAYCTAIFNAAGFSTARRAKLGMDVGLRVGLRVGLGSKTSSTGRMIGAGVGVGGMGAKSRSMGAMNSMLQAYRQGQNSPQDSPARSLPSSAGEDGEERERETEGNEAIAGGVGGKVGSGKIVELESEECEAVMLNDAESLSECFKDLLEEAITASANAAAVAVAAAAYGLRDGVSPDKEGRTLTRRPSATRLLKALSRTRSNSFSAASSPTTQIRGLKEGMTPSPSASTNGTPIGMTPPRSWEQRRQLQLEEKRTQEERETEKATEEEGSDDSDVDDKDEVKSGTAGLFAGADDDGEESVDGSTPKKKKKKLRLKKKAKRIFRRMSGISVKDAKKAKESLAKEGGEDGEDGVGSGEKGGVGGGEEGSKDLRDGKGGDGDGNEGGDNDWRGSAAASENNPFGREGDKGERDNEGSDGEEEDDEAEDGDNSLFVNDDESSADDSSDSDSDDSNDDSSSSDDDDEAVVVVDDGAANDTGSNTSMSLDDWLGGATKTKEPTGGKGSDSDDYDLDMDDRASAGEGGRAGTAAKGAAGIEGHVAANPFGRQHTSATASSAATTAEAAAEAAAVEASAWQSSVLKGVNVGSADVWGEFEDSDDEGDEDDGGAPFAASALVLKLRLCGEWEVYLQQEWAQARARRKAWQPAVATTADVGDSANTVALAAIGQRRNPAPGQQLEQREVSLGEFTEQEQDLEDIRDLLGNSMFDIAFRHVCDRHPGHEHRVFAALDAITQLRRDLTSVRRQEVLASCLKILQDEYHETCGLGHAPHVRGMRGAAKRRDLFGELFPNAPPHPWEKGFFGRSLAAAGAAGGGNGDGGSGNSSSRFAMFRRKPK